MNRNRLAFPFDYIFWLMGLKIGGLCDLLTSVNTELILKKFCVNISLNLLSASRKGKSCIFLYRLRFSQGCRGLGSSCFDKKISLMNLYFRWILSNLCRIIIFVSSSAYGNQCKLYFLNMYSVSSVFFPPLFGTPCKKSACWKNDQGGFVPVLSNL